MNNQLKRTNNNSSHLLPAAVTKQKRLLLPEQPLYILRKTVI
jgi:hypothetical protein